MREELTWARFRSSICSIGKRPPSGSSLFATPPRPQRRRSAVGSHVAALSLISQASLAIRSICAETSPTATWFRARRSRPSPLRATLFSTLAHRVPCPCAPEWSRASTASPGDCAARDRFHHLVRRHAVVQPALHDLLIVPFSAPIGVRWRGWSGMRSSLQAEGRSKGSWPRGRRQTHCHAAQIEFGFASLISIATSLSNRTSPR